MKDYIRSLIDASERNGREAADAAAKIYTGDWTAELVAMMLDHLAEALPSSFPGGSTAFLAFADIALPSAKVGFHCRRREMGKTLPSDLMLGTPH